ITVEAGFHANELRVHVVGGGLTHCGERIGSNACPGTDTDVDALAEGVRTEVSAPSPTGHVKFDRRAERIDPNFAVATESHRLDVAGVELIAPDELCGDAAELIDRVGQFHAVDAARVNQALHMFPQTENRGTLLGFVAADALKYR